MTTKRFSTRAVRGLAPWLWMAFIFWLSSQPSLPSAPEPWQDVIVKKLGHMVLYGVLAMLWWHFLAGEWGGTRTWMYVAFVLTVLYAISDEYHQTFVPGRNGNVWDVMVDTVGAALTLRVTPRLAFLSWVAPGAR